MDFARKVFSADILRILNPLALLDESTILIKNYLDRDQFESAKQIRQELLNEHGLPIRLNEKLDNPIDIEDPGKKGQLLLELYFHQIFFGEKIILAIDKEDFSHQFDKDGSPFLAWNPSPIYILWKEDFHWAVRGLYFGTYTENEKIFQMSLDFMELSSAADLFRDHLGYGKNPGKLFDRDHIKSILLKLFGHYWNSNLPLPSNFISFGIYASILYRHLESLEVELYPKLALQKVVKDQDWEKILFSKFSEKPSWKNKPN